MPVTNFSELVKSEADDIRTLTSHLDTGDFSYVDIALVEAWREALEQWPLLAEWNTWSKENNS